MSKDSDLKNVKINNIQYNNEFMINNNVTYTMGETTIDSGFTLEIHDDGTSQYAHKETEQYANPSGEQVYVVQTDTNTHISQQPTIHTKTNALVQSHIH